MQEHRQAPLITVFANSVDYLPERNEGIAEHDNITYAMLGPNQYVVKPIRIS